jgi:hypothetical protein
VCSATCWSPWVKRQAGVEGRGHVAARLRRPARPGRLAAADPSRSRRCCRDHGGVGSLRNPSGGRVGEPVRSCVVAGGVHGCSAGSPSLASCRANGRTWWCATTARTPTPPRCSPRSRPRPGRCSRGRRLHGSKCPPARGWRAVWPGSCRCAAGSRARTAALLAAARPRSRRGRTVVRLPGGHPQHGRGVGRSTPGRSGWRRLRVALVARRRARHPRRVAQARPGAALPMEVRIGAPRAPEATVRGATVRRRPRPARPRPGPAPDVGGVGAGGPVGQRPARAAGLRSSGASPRR